MERQRLSAPTLSRSLAACTLLTLLLGASGCVTSESFFAMTSDNPKEKVCQATANWTPQVQFVPDTVHQGRSMPGIMGRLYLFGEKVGYTQTCEGTIHLEMSAILPERPQDGWIVMEKLDIDKASLQKLQQFDPTLKGPSYTMFLPWWSYRPDVTQIQMNLSFTPVNGTPLFTVSKVSLNSSESPLALLETRQELGDRRRYVPPTAPAPPSQQPPNGPIQQAGYTVPAAQPAPIGQAIWPPPQKSNPIVEQKPWTPPGGWESIPAAPR